MSEIKDIHNGKVITAWEDGEFVTLAIGLATVAIPIEEWKEARKEYGPYEGITEEDWNKFNLLRAKILNVTCRNSEPISYEQYKKLREFQLEIEGYPGDL